MSLKSHGMAFLKLGFLLCIVAIVFSCEIHAEVQRVQAAPGNNWQKASARGQRDYTLLVVNEVDTEKGRYYRYWTQRNQYGPKPIKGIVRLVVCDGSWSLTAREDGRTQATYWLYTDPAGSIPAWLANTVNTSGLYDILWAIEARAQDLSWQ